MRITLDIPDNILHHLLDPVPIPAMARVSYTMATPPPLADLATALHHQLSVTGAGDFIKVGQRIAIGVGSRGIDRLPDVVAAVVAEIRSRGAEPFIVPTMGSHGGATADGQRAVLAHLGVTEERMSAPIESQMETACIGHTADGAPVLIDRLALAADGIVIVARIKPHTAFRGPYESGLAKMLAIGLGKQAGAASTHARGFGEMARMVPAMAEVVLAKTPVCFGVALLENAHDRIFELDVVPASRILSEEPALLRRAAAAMPRIPYDQLDVLVIDEIGKNISGDGADPNITGRYPTPFASGGPDVTRQVVLDLAAASRGNANGLGTADFTTIRLINKLSLADTYPNALTSTVPGAVKIPMALPSDRLAIAAAILTCHAVDRPPRIMRIVNTLQLAEFWVSEALLDDVHADPAQEIVEGQAPPSFNDDGNLPHTSVAPCRHIVSALG